MFKNTAFTICAKNYFAQALTLKKSFLKHNPGCDFYIFLSDSPEGLTLVEQEELQLLDESWLLNWKQMAFKYNIIEFSTSIKPFCFRKLFNLNYDKVIYLDPDIYVTNKLDEIYEYLDEKSIVLTPHYCNIQTEYTGSITEEEILYVGIYNLGFAAISNNFEGNKIVTWWMNRLENKCYADKTDALHVDQKWMDFIPAFFPNETLITHHMGINPAIWNLHERELIIDEKGNYKVRNVESKELFSLLFFHFSGFDPFNPKLINRRHPKYNTDVYPSYIPLFEDYIAGVYENGYDKYSKMSYSFNSFEDGENVLLLHRRLFRSFENEYTESNPFAKNGKLFNDLRDNKLLTGVKTTKFTTYTDSERNRKGTFVKVITSFFKILKSIIGVRYYYSLLVFLNDFTRFEKQGFLLRKNE